MSTCFVGEIRLFAFSKVPINWVACNGQTVSISQNQELFSLLGTLYGGDGSSTFGIPNLNGRLAIGAGQGPGLPNYTQSATGGSETVTLTVATAPAHSHVFTGTGAGATDPVPGPNFLFATNPDGVKHFARPPAKPTWAALSNQSVSSTGGNTPHNNVMPSMGLQYCIATRGDYPQRQ